MVKEKKIFLQKKENNYKYDKSVFYWLRCISQMAWFLPYIDKNKLIIILIVTQLQIDIFYISQAPMLLNYYNEYYC